MGCSTWIFLKPLNNIKSIVLSIRKQLTAAASVCCFLPKILTRAVYRSRFSPTEFSSGSTVNSEQSAKERHYMSVRLDNYTFLFLFPHRHPCQRPPFILTTTKQLFLLLWSQGVNIQMNLIKFKTTCDAYICITILPQNQVIVIVMWEMCRMVAMHSLLCLVL